MAAVQGLSRHAAGPTVPLAFPMASQQPRANLSSLMSAILSSATWGHQVNEQGHHQVLTSACNRAQGEKQTWPDLA